MSTKVATTQWSQVLAARNGSDTEARAALESLCQTYWQPLYAYIRAQGYEPEEASDLTQGFFTAFLEKDFLSAVNPEKGRFRAFLLVSLRNFLSHEQVRQRALKRGGGTTTISLDLSAGEKVYAVDLAEEMTPEDVFEHRWALGVLDRAMTRLEEESLSTGNEIQFRELQQYLTSPEPQASYGELTEILGMSEGAIRTAVHRLRKRYGQCLRTEIAETVADPADTDDEVRHLLALVRPR